MYFDFLKKEVEQKRAYARPKAEVYFLSSVNMLCEFSGCEGLKSFSENSKEIGTDNFGKPKKGTWSEE